MRDTPPETLQRRVYPLDAHELTEEQVAVAFAMTSRRPEPFDEIAQQVSQEKAADFHERWVLGYGHASVAEHAVVHLAVENVSRLACDALEDNRLASYTEKSSRYQIIAEGSYYFPTELDAEPELGLIYRDTCERLFGLYRRLIDGCMDNLRQTNPQRGNERDPAYRLRLRRVATDSCRAVLPAATLTNVGVTANARVWEHAISKLLSSQLAEERELGLDLREQARGITPTLLKYAEENPYLRAVARRQGQPPNKLAAFPDDVSVGAVSTPVSARLIDWDTQAEAKLATALLYRHSAASYEEVRARVNAMTAEERQAIIEGSAADLGPHDAPVREFELVSYTWEFFMDYGAYREFKRHRIQSYLTQLLTVNHGYRVPDLVADAGLDGTYRETLDQVDQAYGQVYQFSPGVAQYLVTHAHYCRILSQMNLRECYHLFKLRTSQLAHFSIREPMLEALKLAVEVHPQLFRHLRLRDYPGWWPFPKRNEA